MGCGRIPDGDSLFRPVIHPASFHKKTFAFWKFIYLRPGSDDSLRGSLLWGRFVPTIKHVHKRGCEMARQRNEKERAQGTFKEKNRSVYCGAYELKADAVRALVSAVNSDKVSSADVIHLIEDGEIAHTELRIFLKPGPHVEGTKTEIVASLWNSFSGPLAHRCDCDSDINPHPSGDLPLPPAGEYSDERSHLYLLWCLIRFQICYWFWRIFGQNTSEHS